MDNKEQDQNPQPTTAPVMDVQPPQAPAASVTPTEPVAAPVQEQSADGVQPATTEPEAATPLVATPSNKPGHHKAPIGAILVAVIVAVALAAVSVVAYTKTQDKPKDTATQQQTTKQEESVKAEDVDSTTDEIDKELNSVNDDTDFNQDELSDTSLSL